MDYKTLRRILLVIFFVIGLFVLPLLLLILALVVLMVIETILDKEVNAEKDKKKAKVKEQKNSKIFSIVIAAFIVLEIVLLSFVTINPMEFESLNCASSPSQEIHEKVNLAISSGESEMTDPICLAEGGLLRGSLIHRYFTNAEDLKFSCIDAKVCAGESAPLVVTDEEIYFRERARFVGKITCNESAQCDMLVLDV